MDFLDFTEEELKLAGIKLQIENNAFLRVVLANQMKIMDALEIDIDLPKSAYADLMPGSVSDDRGEMALNIQGVEKIGHMLQKRIWEWVKLNNNNTDE